MFDEVDQKFTQLKAIQEKGFLRICSRNTGESDEEHPAHQPGRHLPGGLKDVRGREEDQKDLVVALCLFKPMDKVRREKTRREERDHKYLYSLGLYIAVSLKTRTVILELLTISSQMATQGTWHEFLPGDACFSPWTAYGVLVGGTCPSILLIFVSK